MKINTDGVLLGAWTSVPGTGRILDIGTGCGLIALMLAQRTNLEIDAIDIHEESVIEAVENFNTSPWNDKITGLHTSLQNYSLQAAKKYDLIVCNPPFFSKSLLSVEGAKNLVRHDHSLSFEELVSNVKSLLAAEGVFSVIIPAHRIIEFEKLTKQSGFHCHRKTAVVPAIGKPVNRYLLEYSAIQPDTPNEETTLLIQQSSGIFSAEYKEITRPFYLHF